MIKFTATARIHSISPVTQVSENFSKRELILDDSWTDREGQPRPSFVCVDFTGQNMALLDQFVPGQRVSVEIFVSGREHNGRVYNTLRGQSVTLCDSVWNGQRQATPAYPQPGYAGYPQQGPSGYGQPYPQQPQQQTSPSQYPQQPAQYPAAPSPYPQQQPPQQAGYAGNAPASEQLPWA